MHENMNDGFEYIYHHGVKGQKWGVTRTPEQLGHKPKPKKPKISKEEKAEKKRRQRISKQERKASEKVARAKQKRDKILRSPAQLYKYRDSFSKEEIDEAMKRFKWERELRNMSQQDLRRGKEYIDLVLGYTESGMKAYNTVAKLYNTFSGAKGDDRMKEISGVGSSGKKNKNKDKDDD